MDGDWTGALDRARTHAPYLRRLLEAGSDLTDLLQGGRGEEALLLARRAGKNVADTGIALRREKQALALVLAIGDLAGAFTLEHIMRELSNFADRALTGAIETAIARRAPDAQPNGFSALALGKHGAFELNYSSDIDPVFLYDAQTLPRRPRDEPAEAAQRYARDIVRLLSDNTAEGYVFRVDLRLRPQSEITPLALSFDAALSHYESSALPWERAAFIKARMAAGDAAHGTDFLEAIRPFVWRRSLDFGAIDDIRRLTHRIREQQTGPAEPAPGWNVKLGRGGIREIEFYAQTHQLVHGGRDPSLREPGTLAAMTALAKAGRVGEDAARDLSASYRTLRDVEHRLQMVNDRQTHTLPEGEALEHVARLAGFADGAAWIVHIERAAAPVARWFDALIAEDSAPVVKRLEANSDTIAKLAARVRSWADGRYRSVRSDAARQAFEEMHAPLLDSLFLSPDTDQAVLRWEALLGKLPSAVNLFRLLEARPAMLDQLVRILTLAPPLADKLARRPELLDPLIDRSAFALPGTIEQIAAEMEERGHGKGYEDRLDRIRVVTGEARFALGVQLIEAQHDPLQIAAGLSRLAEAGLQVALRAAEAEFAQAHGRIADSELAILALGRLGGGALTHASDLDIVYLFTGSHEDQSDGRRPLGATMYFNRLAQRVSAALSVPTAEGALYDIDTRLRPQGAQGPLAVSVSGFARYQRDEAWTWEHMALTRGRIVAGSPVARAAIERAMADALSQPRESGKLRADVLAMRAEMAAHKPPRGLLDAKLLRGGLVDLEFLTHYLQLRDGRAIVPALDDALALLIKAGHLPADLRDAQQFMQRLLIANRLISPRSSVPQGNAARELARICGMQNMTELRERMLEARNSVARSWQTVMGEGIAL